MQPIRQASKSVATATTRNTAVMQFIPSAPPPSGSRILQASHRCRALIVAALMGAVQRETALSQGAAVGSQPCLRGRLFGARLNTDIRQPRYPGNGKIVRGGHAVNWFQHCVRGYAAFSGRASTSAFWPLYLVAIAISLACRGMGHLFPTISGVLRGAIGAFLVSPDLAVLTRRLHDRRRSGWWTAAFIVALAIARIGRHSKQPPGNYVLAFGMVFAMLGFIFVLLYIMMIPGDIGPNRYGPRAQPNPTKRRMASCHRAKR